MVGLVAFASLVAFNQIRPWEADLKIAKDEAKKNHTLILMGVSARIPEALIKYKPFGKVGTPERLELWDYSEAVAGRILVPYSDTTCMAWFQKADSVWRRFDALEFRSKSRPSGQNIIDLTIAYASRGDIQKAKTWMALIPKDRSLEDVDLAMTLVGMAQEFANKLDLALATYQTLESTTSESEFKAMAWIGQARCIEQDHKDRAELLYRKVLKGDAISKELKDYANGKISHDSEILKLLF